MRENTSEYDDHDQCGRGTAAELPDAHAALASAVCPPVPKERRVVRYGEEVMARHGSVAAPRLVLRLAARADAIALAALLPEGAEPMLGSWPYPLSSAAALERIEWAIAQANQREMLAYVFSDRRTGRAAGWCSAVRWHEARDDIAMLTYWIGAEFEGRGYVAEAIRAAGPHVLAWIGTSRLGAGAYPYNARSLRTMQHAGLVTPDGVRQLWSTTRGRHEPIVCFAAAREEVMAWRGRPAPDPCAGTGEEANAAGKVRVA